MMRQPVPVETGQTRYDDEGDGHVVVEVNGRDTWVRRLDHDRKPFGPPRRGSTHQIAHWNIGPTEVTA